MARLVPAVIALLLCCLAAASPASAATPKERLGQARSFQFALGAKLTRTNLARLSRRDLVVVDGEDASPAQIRQIQRRGTLVLGYLSVGSVESWRSWFPLLQDHRLEPLGDWEGERYTDVSSAGARDALADTISPSLLDKGFDGLFLDNVDMIEDHAAQAEGMYDLVQRIALRTHGAGKLLMAQNGDAIIGRYLPLLDAWNREDPTGTYDFSHERYVLTDAIGRRLARDTLRTVRAAGVVTTTTDYFGSSRGKDARRAVRLACAIGAIPTVADIALAKVPRTATRCP